MASAAAIDEESNVVTVHPDSHYPDSAWVKIKRTFKLAVVEPLPLDTPVYDDKVRFVCISDTHDKARDMAVAIPKGDVLIHAGDFTRRGRLEEVARFNNFLSSLNDKFKHKIVIAGNHELTFVKEQDRSVIQAFKNLDLSDAKERTECKKGLRNCIYLQDSGIELYGIKIYGSPWQPTHRGWAFNADRGEPILQIWNKIPEKTDVLITHGPPLGIGDRTKHNSHVGCCELLNTVRHRVKPQYHIFGHIHESHGVWTDSKTTFINASICNDKYSPIYSPVIFDVPLPDGFKKD